MKGQAAPVPMAASPACPEMVCRMLRLISKLVPVRGAASALVVLVLASPFAPPVHALDPGGPTLPEMAGAGDGGLAELWDLLTLVFVSGQNRGQIDPDGAQAEGEGDNRGQIDPDGAQVEDDGARSHPERIEASRQVWEGAGG